MSDPSDLDRNVAAQSDQVRDIADRVAALRSAIESGAPLSAADLVPLVVPEPGSFEQITAANRRYLEAAGRTDVQLEDLLNPEDLELLRLDSQRLRWTRGDIVAVGMSGLLGALCSIFEDTIDAVVATRLGLVEKAELIRRWKRETGNLPIDYSGAYSGGGAHRATSAGHDLGRPIEAVRQIVDGQYRGTGWVFGEKQPLIRAGGVRGTPYDERTPCMAVALWVKHLVTDFVTPTSLPLPGWTKLFELAPTQELAEFFQDMYWTRQRGPGWNLRTMASTQMVPLVVVEAAIRSKLLWDAYEERGDLRLTEQERSKQDEMLLAGNGVVALVSVGRAVIECLTTSSPVGLRALNPAVIVRAGHLGVSVHRAQRHRQAVTPTWEDLAGSRLPSDANRLGVYKI